MPGSSRRVWGATERDFIEFVNWASKALHDYVSQTCENHTLAGFNSAAHYEAVAKARPRQMSPVAQAEKGKRKVILGKKMRQFLRKLGISSGSNNYRTILQQSINLATCQIVVSTVTDRDEDRQEAWLETDTLLAMNVELCFT